MEAKYREWLRQLDEDVIQGEFGYEEGEFTVYSSHWRALYDEGLTPRAAWQRALDGFANARIVSEDEAAIAREGTKMAAIKSHNAKAECTHPWACCDTQGPYCQACGMPWHRVLEQEAARAALPGVEPSVMADHSNLFHEALHKVRDIARNGTRNTAAWQEIIDVVDQALEERRRLDAADLTRDPTADVTAGMAWWNALSERERADWLGRAGSATPADAWAQFKRQTEAEGRHG